MKKINSTKLMAILAALCLVTSSFVGSTLAKYITTANSNDAARVAKFGVVLQADGNLFGQDYVDYIVTDDPAASTLAVQSSADVKPANDPDSDDDVVAPGTKNEKGLHFSLNGKPEVATRLNAEIVYENIYLKTGTYAVMVKAPTVTKDSFKADTYYTKTDDTYALATTYADGTTYYTMTDKAVVEGKDYYPVVYSSTDDTNTKDEVGENTLNSIANYYVNMLTRQGTAKKTSTVTVDGKTTYTLQADYDPNFDYSKLDVADETITWEWFFENGDKLDDPYYKDVAVYTYDAADTILGHLIAQKAEKDLTEDKKTFKGEVIDVDTLKAPVEAKEDNAGDYNLETGFGITMTVTQLDNKAGYVAPVNP